MACLEEVEGCEGGWLCGSCSGWAGFFPGLECVASRGVVDEAVGGCEGQLPAGDVGFERTRRVALLFTQGCHIPILAQPVTYPLLGDGIAGMTRALHIGYH